MDVYHVIKLEDLTTLDNVHIIRNYNRNFSLSKDRFVR